MVAGSPFSRDSGVRSLVESPTACATVSQAPCETAPTRDSTPFYDFEFTAERKREMQKLLCSVLKGDYDSTPKHNFRVYPRAAPWLPISRGTSKRLRSENVDFTHHQPAPMDGDSTELSDDELSDDEFSDDNFSDDNID
jgi:hypothetical protein